MRGVLVWGPQQKSRNTKGSGAGGENRVDRLIEVEIAVLRLLARWEAPRYGVGPDAEGGSASSAPGRERVELVREPGNDCDRDA